MSFSQGFLKVTSKRKWIFASASATALALVIGCGGGGGGGNAAGGVIQGDNAQIAVGVADAKAMGAGSIPFMLLGQLSPNGGFLRPANVSRGLTFVTALNLYVSPSVSGKVAKLAYFTDAAGTKAAGTVTATCNETINSTYTFPLTFHVTGSLTGGNIPMTLSENGSTPFLTFSDQAGANTMSGDLNLTKDKIDLNLSNLGLDDSFQIAGSGSITVTLAISYLGLTIPATTVFSSLTGSPATTISGAASVSAFLDPSSKTPTTGTGTGVIDLPNNKFSLSVSLGGFPLTISQSIDGSLNTTTTSGLSKVIGNPWSFVLGSLATTGSTTTTTGTTTTTTGTTSGGTGTFQSGVTIKGMSGESGHTIEQAWPDGEMVGETLDQYGEASAIYWASPTATPILLPAPSGYLYSYARGISVAGSQIVIVGSGTDTHGVYQPVEWFANAGSTSFTAYNPANGINGISDPTGAEFDGISANGNAMVGHTYDSKSVMHPFFYAPHQSLMAALPSDGRTTNLRAIAVDNNNNVLGAGDGTTPVPGVWSKVSISSGSISSPFVSLLNSNGISYGSIQAFHMSSTGVVAGGDGSKALYWSAADSFVPHALSLGSDLAGFAYAVDSTGTKFAGAVQLSTSNPPDLGYWSGLTASPVDVTQLIKNGTSYNDLAGQFILSDGSLICLAVTGTSPFLANANVYVQKK